jgi:hypothetical protein
MKSLLRLSLSSFTTLGLFVALVVTAAQDEVDLSKVQAIRQKAKSGQKLTSDEAAYLERGKAARRQAASRGNDRPTQTSLPAEPSKTSTGLVPLCDMTAGQKYHGQDGGLYGGGLNVPPEKHLQAALEAAASIKPRNAAGNPSADGKIVLLTHGMSNTNLESQGFMEVANADSRKSPAVVLINGALGGIDAPQWISDKPKRNGSRPWENVEQRLKLAGVTPQQVQVVWMKHALARVSNFGAFPIHAQQLRDDLAKIVRLLKERFPNLQLAYLSSRSYAGYATVDLNPEPYAYESAFAAQWLIRDQIGGDPSLGYQSGKAPVMLWGPYLWADGEKGRQFDDLRYLRSDYRDDGTHTSQSGTQRIAERLQTFFTTDPTAKTWYTAHP